MHFRADSYIYAVQAIPNEPCASLSLTSTVTEKRKLLVLLAIIRA